MPLFTNPNKGAGYWGAERGRESDCVNARNGAGHNPECQCRDQRLKRASQTVPYWEHPLDSCDDDCVDCNKPANGKWGRDGS